MGPRKQWRTTLFAWDNASTAKQTTEMKDRCEGVQWNATPQSRRGYRVTRFQYIP